MTTAEQIRVDARGEARRRLREEILAEAAAEAAASGWSPVRMGVLADRVGISRQTLHATFGTKEALGRAVVMRETELVLGTVLAALSTEPEDPVAAVAAAVSQALRSLANNPLLQAILDDPADPLLPLLTSRSRPLIERACAAVAQWALSQCPRTPRDRVLDVTDSLVRLTVSHALLPTEPPDVVATRLAQVFAGATEHGAGRGPDTATRGPS